MDAKTRFETFQARKQAASRHLAGAGRELCLSLAGRASLVAAQTRSLSRQTLDAIFPPEPFTSGHVAAASPGHAAEHWTRIHFLEAPVCDGCGAPFAHDLGAGARCAGCLARPLPFDRVRAACIYDEASRDLILRFKHADRVDLAALFSHWISRAAKDIALDADLFTPVPLHPSRLRQRKYNQAAEIARRLALRFPGAYAPQSLVRRRKTAPQDGKSFEARSRNVAAAFAPGPDAHRIQGARVVLIDDVLTTGATAAACAGLLRSLGAKTVDLAVVARVPSVHDFSI